MNAPAVMPTLTAVPRRRPPCRRFQATWSTRLARAVVRRRTTALTARPARRPQPASRPGRRGRAARGPDCHWDEHRRPWVAVDQGLRRRRPRRCPPRHEPAAAARSPPPGTGYLGEERGDVGVGGEGAGGGQDGHRHQRQVAACVWGGPSSGVALPRRAVGRQAAMVTIAASPNPLTARNAVRQPACWPSQVPTGRPSTAASELPANTAITRPRTPWREQPGGRRGHDRPEQRLAQRGDHPGGEQHRVAGGSRRHPAGDDEHGQHARQQQPARHRRVRWVRGMEAATTTSPYQVTSRPAVDGETSRSAVMRRSRPMGRVSVVT